MSHKMAADPAAVAFALLVLTLGFPVNDARAEALELADAQMEQITAGAWMWSGMAGDFNLIGANGHHYVSTGSQTYRETETGVTWTLASDTVYYADHYAIGVLTSDNPPQRYDGGYALPPHPK